MLPHLSKEFDWKFSYPWLLWLATLMIIQKRHLPISGLSYRFLFDNWWINTGNWKIKGSFMDVDLPIWVGVKISIGFGSICCGQFASSKFGQIYSLSDKALVWIFDQSKSEGLSLRSNQRSNSVVLGVIVEVFFRNWWVWSEDLRFGFRRKNSDGRLLGWLQRVTFQLFLVNQEILLSDENNQKFIHWNIRMQ